MLTKALTSFSDRLPKNGKRKTFETVSTQELCKYLVCIKQCCWQGGQIFSCWLLWTFDPNSPPRIPEHTTSKSNSMTTDYFLINLMMNHTNNKYTKKCRHDTLRLWTQLIDKSVKLSRRRSQTDIGEFKIMAAPPRGGRWTSLDASFARCFAIFWNIVKTSHR